MDLVGLSEVAEMAGVSRQAVVNWRARFNDFPSPKAELASGPVWEKQHIEIWISQREKQIEGTLGNEADAGEPRTHELGLSDFDKIQLATAIEAEVFKSENYSISITTGKNLFDYIDVTQSDKTLRLRLKSRISFHGTRVKVIIGMPELMQIKLSGACRASLKNFDSAKQLNALLSGASNLNLINIKAENTNLKATGASNISGNLEAARCVVTIAGASTLNLNGTASTANAEITGASTARLSGFTVRDIEVKASGASMVRVFFTGKMNAEASGVSRITYAGEGTVGTVRISGASSIKKSSQ